MDKKFLSASPSIDEMVSRAHRESQPEAAAVKVATNLVFTVTPARREELDHLLDVAKKRLFAEEQ